MKILKIFFVFCRLKCQEIYKEFKSFFVYLFKNFLKDLSIEPVGIKLIFIGLLEMIIGLILFGIYLEINWNFMEVIADVLFVFGLFCTLGGLYFLICPQTDKWLCSNWQEATKIVEEDK